jgi:hypothetical protein
MTITGALALDLLPVEVVDFVDFENNDYVIKEEGLYLGETLVSTQASVWIDSLDSEGTYHVDSMNFDDTNVTLQFYYEIQPDYINHYSHKGAYVTTYYPSSWTWIPNNDPERGGGIVQLEVVIDFGLGSNLFPIGIDGTHWVTDSTGYYDFDGINDYIDIPDLELTTNGSFSVWFYYESSVGNTRVISSDDSKGNNGEMRTSYTTSNFDLYMGNGSSTAYSRCNSGFFEIDDKWSNIVGSWVYDGSQTNITLYFDDVQCISALLEGPPEDGDKSIQIGAINDGSFFNGSIYNFYYYNRSLGTSEISSYYSLGKEILLSSLNTTGLVSFYNFDDGLAGDQVSGYDGVIVGGVYTNASYTFRSLVNGTDFSYVSGNDNLTLNWLNTGYDWVNWTAGLVCGCGEGQHMNDFGECEQNVVFDNEWSISGSTLPVEVTEEGSFFRTLFNSFLTYPFQVFGLVAFFIIVVSLTASPKKAKRRRSK